MAGIDRINGTTPYDNKTINRKVQDTDGSKDDSGFRLLSEEAEGVIYEPGRAPADETKTIAQVREEIAREERAAAQANLHSRFDGPGVEVELSTDGVQLQEKPAQQSIGSIFRDALRAVADFFLSIWNGGSESAGSEAAATADDVDAGETYAGAVTEAADSEQAFTSQTDTDEARPISTRTNSPEDIASFMSNYGGRRLAKNSDLLTQYDRTGHIVDVDPSDRRRILQGEGRVRRY